MLATTDQLLFAAVLGVAILALIGAVALIGMILIPERRPRDLPRRIQGLNRRHPAAKTKEGGL